MLEQQLSAMRMGDDKRVLAELGQVIADKDKQIEVHISYLQSS